MALLHKKHMPRIVFKQKDVTDYYKDNPEDRILNLKKKLQKKNTR